MARDRDVTAACMILTVAWSLLGFASGFFTQLPAEASYRDFAVLVPVLVFLPLIRSPVRWTALATGIIGIVTLISALYSLITFPAAFRFGPAVSLIFVFFFTFFAFRAYRREDNSQNQHP
jgi:hypothetical protein